MGFSTVVVHTLMNPGGELGAYPTIMNGSASMNMGANVLTLMGGPSAMSTGMQGPAPKSSVMPMHMGMGM